MRPIHWFLAALLAIALIGVPGARLVLATGNGAPSGTHYNLNIIGVPKDKTADMNNNDGHRIFVQLVGGQDAAKLSGQTFNTITRLNKIFLQPAPPRPELPGVGRERDGYERRVVPAPR